MITLKADRLLVRWFFNSAEMLHQIADSDTMFNPGNYKVQTNLCTMIRVLVLSTVTILGALALLGGAIYLLFVRPVIAYGTPGIYGIGSMFAILALILVTVSLKNKYQGVLNQRRHRRRMLKLKQAHLRREKNWQYTTEPTAPSLLGAYLRGLKDRTCVLIKWSDPVDAEMNRIWAKRSALVNTLGVPFGVYFGVFIIIAIIGVVLNAAVPLATFVYAKATAPTPVTTQVTCAKMRAGINANTVYVTLECGERVFQTGDAHTVLYFINNPNASLPCEATGTDLTCSVPD